MKACLPLPVLAFAATACISSGQVHEITKPQPMTPYKTALVRIHHANPSAVNAALKVRLCEAKVAEQLTKKEVFDKVLSSNSNTGYDVELRGLISDTDEGYNLLQRREEAKVNMVFTFYDAKNNQSLGEVSVWGDSRRNGVVLGTDAFKSPEDALRDACNTLGDRLANYLKDASGS